MSPERDRVSPGEERAFSVFGSLYFLETALRITSALKEVVNHRQGLRVEECFVLQIKGAESAQVRIWQGENGDWRGEGAGALVYGSCETVEDLLGQIGITDPLQIKGVYW